MKEDYARVVFQFISTNQYKKQHTQKTSAHQDLAFLEVEHYPPIKAVLTRCSYHSI